MNTHLQAAVSPAGGESRQTRPVPVCAECGTDNPEIAKFCLACGSPLAAAPSPQEFRKVVTVVFSDLKGSTSMGERLDSESLREVMSRYFDAMRAELERHGGVVEKFIGDAVMAVFGLPKLHEDDALRAVRAAAGMQRALAELNLELEHRWGVTLANRTGVNTGEVVSGDPTAGQRLVTGDTVNVAARLEQAAPAMEVLLGELTYTLVRDAVEVEPVEPLELKGKAERVPAFRLLSVADTGEGWARRQDAPMVGREVELALLLSAFEETLTEQSCRLVTVVADAGVGKSRLNDEFMQSVGRRAQVLRGRCLSYGDGITFWPLVEAVRQAAAIREDDPPGEARTKIAALVDGGDDAVVARVAAAIGLGGEQYPIEELFWGARKLLETLARRRPLIVLFDDIHWAEPTFLDLVDHLVDSVQDAPVLLLCPARHELLEDRPDWAERPGATRVVLEPLTAADTAAIVENLLGKAGIDEDARARIVAAAEGNPLYVEQMLSMLIDGELLRFEEGRWTAHSDLADLAVPPSIQALLASRLDSLATEERSVVEPASVIGQVFPQPAVEELAPDAVRPHVPAYLVDLARKQFVRPDLSAIDEERFRFNHVLIREAAYNGLLKRARATLHERFVEWADRVNRERGREAEYEEILGYHLEQAYHYLDELGPLDDHGRELGVGAAARLSSAGRRAFGRGDMPAAANLFRRAAALLPEDDSRRLELLPDLAEALVFTGEYGDAATTLDEAIESSARLAEPTVEARAKLVRLGVRLHTGETENWSAEVAHETEWAISVFEPLDDRAGLAKAWQLRGYAHGIACHFGQTAAAFSRALEHARLAGDAKQEARCATQYALALVHGPTPAREAIARCEEIVEQVANDRQAQATILSCFAYLEGMLGEVERAREHYGQALALLDDLGLRGPAAAMTISTGGVEKLAGDLERAEREFRRGYDSLEQLGETYFRSTLACLLARVLHEAGRYDESERYALIAAELAADDDVETQASLRAVQAKVEARQGHWEEAERLIDESVSLLSQTDFAALRAEALLDRAEILAACGQDAGARAAAEEALALAERKETRPEADRARELLSSLSQAPSPR
jgi:predicted ATPase/class 3 adenylate cyclase